MTIQELINKLQNMIQNEVSPDTEILFKELKVSYACAIEFVEINHVDEEGNILYEDDDDADLNDFQKCVVLESWA